MPRMAIIAGAANGLGHLRAAEHLANALAKIRTDLDVRAIDILDFLPTSVRWLYDPAWRYASVHASRSYRAFYRYSVRGRLTRASLGALAGAAARRLLRKHPEVAIFVGTHSLAAAVGSQVKCLRQCMLSVVATDFVLQPHHVFSNVDAYFVPPECTVRCPSDQQTNLGAKLHHVGIPIDPLFAATADKRELRRRHGFDSDVITVLVSFGGTGLGADRHLGVVDTLLTVPQRLQVVVLCGQNDRAAERFRERYQAASNLRVYNLLPRATDFVRMADVFIGKAGGVSLSEALAAELPIAVIDALPGQEEFNAELLSRHGRVSLIQRKQGLLEWLQSDRLCSRYAGPRFADPRSSALLAQHLADLPA